MTTYKLEIDQKVINETSSDEMFDREMNNSLTKEDKIKIIYRALIDRSKLFSAEINNVLQISAKGIEGVIEYSDRTFKEDDEIRLIANNHFLSGCKAI